VVTMRLQGSAELNRVREAVGLRPVERPATLPTLGQSEPGVTALQTGLTGQSGYPGAGVRRLIGLVTVLSVGVALTHPLLSGALAGAHSAGPWGAAAAVLAWPAPVIQQILAGVGAFVLGVIGALTGGWREIGPRQACLLAAGAMAAVLGAGPMIMVCVLTVVACVLIATFIVVIAFSVLTALSR
jgi:hypothetical protein